ncbi:hypothetical protein BDV24DRAFT_143124 [Aspergillus arachidicola]|uniref:Uncharacterized protein n=1 Tax=Aspergillus arachidicola TaxID=656916 RepID=A0A5N6XS75_9EURO|nr:hypothetical protein BDV24DRAFT_143124 [Aspergillus arachidicola]
MTERPERVSILECDSQALAGLGIPTYAPSSKYIPFALRRTTSGTWVSTALYSPTRCICSQLRLITWTSPI